MNTEPLVGPRAHERHGLTPERVTLAEGMSLYHAFMPDKPHVSNEEVQDAKRQAAYYLEKHPDLVLQCQGKTAEEARAILESGDTTVEQAAA